MAISADGIYSETLQSIIDAKLEELVRKKDAYETSKTAVLKSFSLQSDEAEKVRILREGIKTCFKLRNTSDGGYHGDGVNADLVQLLQNLDRFLDQPRYDPSLSTHQLQTWAASLSHYFDVQSNRYEFASLYAKLATEWLNSEKKLGVKMEGTDVEMTESFEELESSAKLQSRQEWEDLVFQSSMTDSKAIKSLLKQLLGEDTGEKELVKALTSLRGRIASFESQMACPGHFNSSTLRWSIQGLLSGDLLSEEKRVVLKDFLNNNVILAEIADVLNLRIANIEDWSWGPTVPVVQQRKLAGQYSIYMQEDLLQAIFLQYIGVKWSVFLKAALKDFVKSEAWLSARQEIPNIELKRRGYFLGSVEKTPSVQSKRFTLWFRRYFMTQLLGSEQSSFREDDGAEEVDFSAVQRPGGRTKQTARVSTGGKAPRKQLASRPSGAKRHRRIVSSDADKTDDFARDDDSDDEEDDEKSQDLMGLKQGLLHLLRTEILVNTRLHGEISGIRAQFENWNSLLPHPTILAVAEFLGVSKLWLGFFQTFLEAPLAFTVGDAVEDARIRRRGAPGSHPLSDVLGEMILFCLDLSVNQATSGQRLWRVHDDLWFWSTDPQTTVKAWSTITKFADVMGLSIDKGRAGSVRVFKDAKKHIEIDQSLPQDKIRWGFLYLDSHSGQWEIDETLVDSHTVELRKQLKEKNGSALSWIQAWNVYANTFFTTNFAKPAKCFGQAHTRKVLTALEKVQKKLFEGDSSHNVVEHLKTTLEQRFGISDVPEAYFFFPTELGGLELRNPFISLLLVHETFGKDGDPESMLDMFEKAETEHYESAKKTFEKGEVSRYTLNDPDFAPDGEDRHVFMSFEEFTKYREDLSYDYTNNLRDIYSLLLEECTEHQVTAMSDIMTAMNLMDKGGVIAQSSGINGNWYSMTPYWKWVTQMYGGEIVKRFGGLNIVDNGVLPIGMVSLFRSNRVQWKA